jgi:hypothetical protein
MVSGGTRALGDVASFDSHNIAEAQLTAIPPRPPSRHVPHPATSPIPPRPIEQHDANTTESNLTCKFGHCPD